MSYPIISASIKWKLEGYKKTPNFNSVVQKTAASRGNAAASLKPFCTWDFDLELPANQSSILATSSIVSEFIGNFAATQGQGGLFLFNDVTDNTVTVATSGMLDVTPGSSTPMASTGNGTSTQFQLVRSLGSIGWDVIQNLNGSALVYVNGVLTSVTMSSAGVATFSSAPANASALTWSGSFYFLCRFSSDSFKDLSMVGYNPNGPLWQCTGITFSSEFV
jgi:hypothetical protein